MRDALLRRYHDLPPTLRSAVASIRGGYLRAWRYGPGADALRDEALARDWWSAERWRGWQEERLAFVLHRAATRVPYYRAYWSARRQAGDRASWERIENWPVLDKEPLRQQALAFVADDCDPRRMFHEHTSGTTGKSVDLWVRRSTVRSWYALYEARCRSWYGVSRRDRWAIVGGQLVAPVAQSEPPFWVWNAGLHQLYMSAYHIAPATVAAYASALARYRVRFVLGYPSALYALSREILAQRIGVPAIDAVVLNAEPLLDHQRDVIARAFRCAVRETYGMSETVAAASECEHGRMHLWPEVGWLEVAQNGEPVEAGATGDLLCTGLLNADMPLVRYAVGDRAALAPALPACACGRGLPMLHHVDGRSDDVLYTQDGRAVGRMDPVFKSGVPISEAQIIQETLTRIRVRYVPAPGFRPEDGEVVADRVRARLGQVAVVMEAVESIPRTSNGKFRAVVCQLSPEERRRVRAR